MDEEDHVDGIQLEYLEFMDALAPDFDSRYGSDIRDHERDLFERHLPKPPASILDVGCGTGRLLPWFSKRGYTVVALEPSGQMHRLCVRRIREHDLESVSVENTTFLRSQLESESFDAVLMLGNVLGSIHPLNLRQKFLREARRLLAPEGMFLIDASNILHCRNIFRCYWNLIRYQLTFGDTQEHTLIKDRQYRFYSHLFSVWGLRNQLTKIGFSIQAVYGVKSVYDNSKLVSGFITYLTDPFLIVCKQE